MTGNLIWAIFCFAFGVAFLAIALIFALLKEKGAVLISGFNTMSIEKREKYDKRKISGDMRNSLLLWAAIMFIGGILSYFITFHFAIAAFSIWIVLLFMEVKLDPEKAFEKYKI